DTASVPTTPGTSAIPVELVALQLETVAPVDFAGLGLDNYFVTLQKVRGGPASTGRESIHFADASGGTFDSFFDVFFDIRKGDLNGPIVFSDDLLLSQMGTPWGRIPPPGSVEIEGVNLNLDGSDNAEDFWPLGNIIEQHPNGAVHEAVTATP